MTTEADSSTLAGEVLYARYFLTSKQGDGYVQIEVTPDTVPLCKVELSDLAMSFEVPFVRIDSPMAELEAAARQAISATIARWNSLRFGKPERAGRAATWVGDLWTTPFRGATLGFESVCADKDASRTSNSNPLPDTDDPRRASARRNNVAASRRTVSRFAAMLTWSDKQAVTLLHRAGFDESTIAALLRTRRDRRQRDRRALSKKQFPATMTDDQDER